MNTDETAYESTVLEPDQDAAEAGPLNEDTPEDALPAAEMANADEDPPAAEEQESSAEPPPLEPLAHLPLQLTLRSGQLSLTLEQLRRLDTGSVLEVHGTAPGYATLLHGEQLVAEGELVDVDGRLGLQITRLASLS
ncbi:FliM/FliN family flagellar motor switch protein [Pseudomonas sp. LRF_L74]|uniref:FliM/FliN family flagellar motor switch protein n=1 Tax=Pseudomonas sp. LRF_L74 TaxID=3369422 RepID=UPI003F5DDF66